MLEIAQACYLEDVLFGKKEASSRTEISSFVEQSQRLEPAELIAKINEHIGQQRMFLCGMSITAADIVVFAHVAKDFAALSDFEKIDKPHVFRWIDHIQHLPGMLELAHSKGLFVAFPDENVEGPSKA